MHRLILALLVFGVFVGLGERVIAQVGGFTVDIVVSDDCCGSHDDHHSEDDDHQGPHCPPGPHHHHTGSCFGGFLVVEDSGVCRLRATDCARTRWFHGDEETPEGPVLLMDKPPLI